ncbi:Rhophilin-2 [Sparganum proliferum]
MIPIGLKATHPVDFSTPFSQFVESHYHQDAANFEEAFRQLNSSRERICLPLRSEEGIKDFRRYYLLLATAERRFFDETVRHKLYFRWSDAFTGEEHCQRSAAFEKGAVLFNFAALCSHIAVNIPPDSSANLDQRISYFLQAKSNLGLLNLSPTLRAKTCRHLFWVFSAVSLRYLDLFVPSYQFHADFFRTVLVALPFAFLFLT